MRLLRTSDLQLEEYIGSTTPEYAILSHTWGEDELSYKEMRKVTAETKRKEGYKKVEAACRYARREGHSHIWIDATNIDKRSSADLSEAINSMYNWYRSAVVCYAYLSDVPPRVNSAELRSLVRSSRWFRRGWTLQELIAPRNVIFLANTWEEIGTRSSFAQSISEVTGIPEIVLKNNGTALLKRFSIAQKMSWAAKRQCTRVEDIAYCLMGLFNVNMPLLYGEGTKAFQRLQEEIMKNSDDESIFLWRDMTRYYRSTGGVLATSPALFSSWPTDCVFLREKSIKIGGGALQWPLSTPYTKTNKGLEFEMPLVPIENAHDLYLAPIGHVYLPFIEKQASPLGILLIRSDSGQNRYQRVAFNKLIHVHENWLANARVETIYLSLDTNHSLSYDFENVYANLQSCFVKEM